MSRLLQGLVVWGFGLALALTLPGSVWKAATPPAFPWSALGPAALAVASLAVLAPLLAWLGGPTLAARRSLALVEAPPDLLWAALLLALWPPAWGPPAQGAWLVAFLAAALPGEVRWLAQALPGEHPFPQAWGAVATRRVRRLVLRRLGVRWLAARLPVWLTATLVLERMLGVPGLGTDWLTRVAGRDRRGLAVWVGLLAGLWLLTRPWRRETA
ncbi:MAG: hypothetical protein HGB30_10430 [Holophagaceae bacterium]|nr:hypothetical protein [Holophagaceae bacterium]